MYRRLRILAAGLALLAVAAGCGGESPSAGGPELPEGSTMKAIQERGKLVVGTKFDQPGFGAKSLSDEAEGFDIEVAELIAKDIFGDDIEGKIEFVEAQSRVREEFIEQGKVDIVVATYSITDERKQRVDFAGPYLVAGQSLLVKKDDNSINGTEDLKGKKVCSVQGSTPYKRIEQMVPEADLSLVFDVYGDCVEALKDGRIDAVTTDDQILLGYVSENPDELKVVGRPFSTENYGIGVKKGDTQFRGWLNDKLEEMFNDGTWEAAYTETIGAKTGAPVPPKPTIDRY